MRVSERELVAGASDPTPQASLLFSQSTASTDTCDCTPTYTLHWQATPWQMLGTASQLPRAWCSFMYKGARGHGGIQTPIYPPSRIARVSGRPVVPLPRERRRRRRRTEPLSASAIRRHRASLCLSPTWPAQTRLARRRGYLQRGLV